MHGPGGGPQDYCYLTFTYDVTHTLKFENGGANAFPCTYPGFYLGSVIIYNSADYQPKSAIINGKTQMIMTEGQGFRRF